MPEDIPRFAILDLDGTLLDDRKNISRRNRSALRRWRERGGGIILASARPPRMARRVLEGFDLSDYLICYNGALTFRGADLIRSRTASFASVRPVLDAVVARSPATFVALEIDDSLYCTSSPGRLFGDVPWKPFSVDAMPPEAEVAKVIVENGPDLEGVFSGLPSYSVFVTDRRRIVQIAPPGTDKKTAVDAILEAEECDWARCVAFGDDENDLQMLGASGVSVAMGNAVDAVKRSCTLHTVSNNEDGVAVILEKLLNA